MSSGALKKEDIEVGKGINRIHWLDAMKVVGITIIVAGHYTPPHFEYLYTFSVQMFFIMSGFLTKPLTGNHKLWVHKIIKQLILPMLILGVAYNVLFALSQVIFGSMTFALFLRNLLGIICGDIFALAGLWFVYSLILSKIISIFIHDKFKPCLALTFIIIAIWLNKGGDNELHSCYTNTLLAYPCFYIGELLGKFKEDIDKINDVKILSTLILVGLVGSLIAFCNNGTVWMYECDYGGNMIMFLLGSIAGTIFCFGICKLFFDKFNKYVLLISEGTILILAFHGLIIRLTHHINVGYGFYIEAIILVIAFIPAIIICKKYIPVLIGYR